MKYDLDSLKGKKVLITGGNGAIGEAIAEGFIYNSTNVYLWGHKECDNILPGVAGYKVVELTDRREIERAFYEFIDESKGIDVLVNCAGYTKGEKSELYPYEAWEKTLAVNLTAPFLLCQKAAEYMIPNRSGSIINITSIGAELGFPENPAYGASKGGLKQLTKTLSCDWSKYGIRVNNVGPGYTRTKMTSGSWENAVLRQERTERTMVGKWALPEDIVGAVLFLASDLSRYITGQDIYVDGGWCAKGL